MAKKVKVSAGGEKHVVYQKTNKIGKGKPGDIMVNHPTKDKGKWDTINLTKIGRAKTVREGVAATKKWHRDNPDYQYKGKKKYQAINSQVDLYGTAANKIKTVDSLPMYERALKRAINKLNVAREYGYPGPISNASKTVNDLREKVARWTSYNQGVSPKKKGGQVKTKKK